MFVEHNMNWHLYDTEVPRYLQLNRLRVFRSNLGPSKIISYLVPLHPAPVNSFSKVEKQTWFGFFHNTVHPTSLIDRVNFNTKFDNLLKKSTI